MKLNESTLAVLRNFADINSNLFIAAGNKITTISESKTISGVATLDQSFPSEFGLYEAPDFLTCLGLIDGAELSFTDKYVDIVGAGRRIKYFYTDKELLTTPKASTFEKMDEVFTDDDIKVTLKEEQLVEIKKVSGALKASRLTFSGGGGSVVAKLVDPENKTANSFSMTLRDYDGPDFDFSLDMASMKVIRGDYDISISPRGLTRFQNLNRDITYFIPLDKNKG